MPGRPEQLQTGSAAALRAPAWIIGMVLLFVVTPLSCSRSGPSSEVPENPPSGLLPMSLHGMPLVAVTTGDDAESLIRRLHGEDVAPMASAVGRYEGGGAQAMLYVSRFSHPAESDSILGAMDRSIGTGTRSFAHHTRINVDGVAVHAVLGQGQTHFFFARGAVVTWLAVDRAMARVALADLLGVAPERVPTGIVIDGVDLLPPPDSLYRRGRPRAFSETGR